ncbi:MAG: uracil-DNA glycosylase family protein [Bacteroidota bacterium]
MTWHERIIQFYNNIKLPVLPPGVESLLPFSDEMVAATFNAFYHKFYNDTKTRRLIIGINPGRFGGGVTGVPFTDPIRLACDCGIANPFPLRQELSSVFMYQMIRAFGGPEAFYRQFYITSYSPVGFTKAGKNLNYYDDKDLAADIEPFAVSCLNKQLEWEANRDTAFCLGDGKNFQFLTKLNAKHGFFKSIIPLPHPRFIMQYKLKQKEVYIDRYLQAFCS